MLTEFPWWYWGSDFSNEEVQQMPFPTILHASDDEKVLFWGPEGLQEKINPNVWDELDKLGQYLNELIENHADNLSWEADRPGEGWAALDRDSTASRLLPFLDNHMSSRNILQNAIHNKNAEEPDQVSFLYNLFVLQRLQQRWT